MNELSKLVDKILAEAKETAAKTEEAARQEAAHTLEAAKAEAAAQEKALLDSATRQAQAIAHRAQSQIGMEARSMRLSARRQSIDQAFQLAAEKMTQVSAQRLLPFLAGQAAIAASQNGELIFNQRDQELGAQVVAKANELLAGKGLRLTLSAAKGSFQGGFVLREGSIETNCTYEVMISGVQDELEGKVAQALLA